MSRPAHRAALAVKVQVTVTDLAAVQRVLTLLTGRGYAPTRLEAEEAGAGRWRVCLDTVADADGVDLLEARLHRLPSVLDVESRWGGALAAAV
jgi:acetolactate synthase regulatory subunit